MQNQLFFEEANSTGITIRCGECDDNIGSPGGSAATASSVIFYCSQDNVMPAGSGIGSVIRCTGSHSNQYQQQQQTSSITDSSSWSTTRSAAPTNLLLADYWSHWPQCATKHVCSTERRECVPASSLDKRELQRRSCTKNILSAPWLKSARTSERLRGRYDARQIIPGAPEWIFSSQCVDGDLVTPLLAANVNSTPKRTIMTLSIIILAACGIIWILGLVIVKWKSSRGSLDSQACATITSITVHTPPPPTYTPPPPPPRPISP
jgi:hypothetical protein